MAHRRVGLNQSQKARRKLDQDGAVGHDVDQERILSEPFHVLVAVLAEEKDVVDSGAIEPELTLQLDDRRIGNKSGRSASAASRTPQGTMSGSAAVPRFLAAHGVERIGGPARAKHHVKLRIIGTASGPPLDETLR